MKINNIQYAIMIMVVLFIAIFAEVLLLGSAYETIINMWEELTEYTSPRWSDALLNFIATLTFLIIAALIPFGMLQTFKKKGLSSKISG